MEEKIKKRNIKSIEDFNRIMKENAEIAMKRRYRRRKDKNNDRKEPPWMTSEIRQEIKKRKFLNRQKRNEEDEEMRERINEQYMTQKKTAQNKIKREILKHEETITMDIRSTKKSKKLWENIDKLRRNEKRNKEEIQIYNSEGKVLNEEDARKELVMFWEKIYKKQPNNMHKEWSDEVKPKYVEELNSKVI